MYSIFGNNWKSNNSGKEGKKRKQAENQKKNVRAKKRKGGWQSLGFKTYKDYLLAKKNGELENLENEETKEENETSKSEESE